ncbi:MAG: hypothetical protein ACF8Q5_12975 [Phycisphaerales bacterium JB040]
MQFDEFDKYENVRRVLRRVGFVALGLGILCWVLAISDFMISFMQMARGDGDRVPMLFFLGFIGGPLIPVGLAALVIGYSKEIIEFCVGTFSSATGGKTSGDRPSDGAAHPGVRASGSPESDGTEHDAHITSNICVSCAGTNPADALFCQSCGRRLHRTG